jgi:SAM-dependent methyltransferase
MLVQSSSDQASPARNRDRQRIDVFQWIDPASSACLDVGCNVGALLSGVARHCTNASLVGVDINREALEIAKQRHRQIRFVHADACDLPFENETFDTVTCLEVIEHLESARRAEAFREMRRVARRGSRLIVSTPHHGWFSWLDANNVRFRVPSLYGKLIKSGVKDASYDREDRPIVWHEHFRPTQLIELAGPGWRPIATLRGGLFVAPVVDWIRWPFYRTGRGTHPVSLLLERVAAWDTSHDYGRASWRMMLVFDAV